MSHAYTRVGVYTVTLTIKDQAGNTQTRQTIITVTETTTARRVQSKSNLFPIDTGTAMLGFLAYLALSVVISLAFLAYETRRRELL
jgi:hypothetical protein